MTSAHLQDETSLADFLPGPICASCSRCCKSMPGGYVPADFGPHLQDEIRDALKSGRVVIDWWSGDTDVEAATLSRVLYLRPATKGKEGQLMDPSWGGECTFLGPEGCTLSREEMPTECKALRPKATPEGSCVSAIGKRGTAHSWREFQSVIEVVVEDLE